MKNLRYRAEAVLVQILFVVFRVIGMDASSATGGWIGRTIGPRLAASRKAKANLMAALPGQSDDDYNRIIRDMWDNLGRVIAEYPHLLSIIRERIEVEGADIARSMPADKPLIIMGAHYGNWELLPFYFNYVLKRPMAAVYRVPNNPYTEKILDLCRNPEPQGTYIPKSTRGARQIFKLLDDKGWLAILIDQKYNQGIAVPFFGRPAMTSDSFAQLSARYDCPILPLQIERLKGCHFRLTVHAPFYGAGKNAYDTVMDAHALLESWIRKNPGQWLWLHRRWDSKALKEEEKEEEGTSATAS